MHPAKIYHEMDKTALIKRVRAHPFAVVIGVSDSRPHIAHTPCLISDDGVLHFHLANANSACQAIIASGQALCVFTGEHDYISPRWYGMENQVPTWNYISAEAEGAVRMLEDGETRQFLSDLGDAFETPLNPDNPWKLGETREDSIAKMLRAITAFELTPSRFEGITKQNQNKPEDVRARVQAFLAQKSS